jgi:thioredoxin 1
MPRGALDTAFLPMYVTATVLLVPFFNAVASKAGDDAYAWLKKLVSRAVTVQDELVPPGHTAAELSSGTLSLRDAEAPVGVTLDLQLPDIAFRRLAQVDWAALLEIKPSWQGSVRLRWSPDDESWWIDLFNRRAPLTGAVLDVDERNFQADVVEATKPVLIHFWADWAGPSRLLADYLPDLARERSDLVVAQVNVDEQPAILDRFGILTVPTLLLFNRGQVVAAFVGLRPKSEIVEQIDTALSE